MKQEYTRSEVAALLETLRQVFQDVMLVDAASGAILDDRADQPTGEYCQLPVLDDQGRGWQPLSGEELSLLLYYSVAVENRACLLLISCHLPDTLRAENREANALLRQLAKYQEELNRDYVTGAYNRRYLAETWQPAMTGHTPCAVLVRVNEYASVCSEYGSDAGDNCLNAAAGILQRAVGADPNKGILVRLEDGMFLLTADCPAAQVVDHLRQAMDESRHVFSISLSRRAEFTMAIAAANWVEAGSWDLLLALAEQRLADA
ncbi:GGDEF domain-containing protein [uncultured Gemmiger sp.]|uniref:GGDEF domain-containing protein n=1 Tax=uncultured Gemmiger sp. TaxID=1623490 RepID=UPI0025E7FAA2|nr:GGDEF domain-containing protein [uncultured Gemmiger sp.]